MPALSHLSLSGIPGVDRSFLPKTESISFEIGYIETWVLMAFFLEVDAVYSFDVDVSSEIPFTLETSNKR